MQRDARTAPRWLQPLQLGFLAIVVAYFVGVFQISLSPSMPRWAMPGIWQMFTLRDPNASQVVAFAKRGGDWEPVDLATLFPSRWGSGYRYSRNSVKKSRSRMRVLGASTCVRLAPTPDVVRFVERRWDKVLGSTARANPRERELLVHRCSARVRLADGRILADGQILPAVVKP